MAAHENDGVFLIKLLLKVFEIGQHVETVDAAVGPEVDQHELALEVFQGQWLRVEPSVVRRKLRHFKPFRILVAVTFHIS